MTSYLDWHVGMKLVCIASAERIALRLRENPGARYPANGGIYTIREIRDDVPLGGSMVVILLNEVHNSHFAGRPGYRFEPGFPPHGFRPVQPRQTDISIFTEMLVSPPKVEDLSPVVFSDQEPS